LSVAAARWPADALMTSSGTRFSTDWPLLVEFAARQRLPAIYYTREFATWRPNDERALVVDMLRRSATHVDKVLRGASPVDLPVEQPKAHRVPR